MTATTRYLIALYLAEQHSSTPVSSGYVAEELGISHATTTQTFQRLDSKNLVVYEPYHGATLTEDGRETAKELYETYRILARFFDEVLDLNNYEEEAMDVAGNVSPIVAEHLAAVVFSE